jgi:hypothetical protein
MFPFFRRSGPFSRKLEKSLLAAGWHVGRRADLATHDEALAIDGLSLTSEARAFMEEFGGLSIPVPGGEPIDLTAGYSELVYPERLADYRARTGRDVVVVGRAQGMFLLLASDGAAYLAFDDDLVSIAADARSALEHLIRRKRGRALPPNQEPNCSSTEPG